MRKSICFGTVDALGSLERRPDERRGASIDGDTMAFYFKMVVYQTGFSVNQGQLKVWYRTDDADHFRSNSSYASSRAYPQSVCPKSLGLGASVNVLPIIS